MINCLSETFWSFTNIFRCVKLKRHETKTVIPMKKKKKSNFFKEIIFDLIILNDIRTLNILQSIVFSIEQMQTNVAIQLSNKLTQKCWFFPFCNHFYFRLFLPVLFYWNYLNIVVYFSFEIFFDILFWNYFNIFWNYFDIIWNCRSFVR